MLRSNSIIHYFRIFKATIGLRVIMIHSRRPECCNQLLKSWILLHKILEDLVIREGFNQI